MIDWPGDELKDESENFALLHLHENRDQSTRPLTAGYSNKTGDSKYEKYEAVQPCLMDWPVVAEKNAQGRVVTGRTPWMIVQLSPPAAWQV